MEALLECYNNARHWSSRQQILSIMADRVNFIDLRGCIWIPSLTKYRYDIARHHTLLHGRGAAMSTVNNTRICVKEEKLDHFLSSPAHSLQDLPFAEKTLRFSSHEELKIPSVVQSQILDLYQ